MAGTNTRTASGYGAVGPACRTAPPKLYSNGQRPGEDRAAGRLNSVASARRRHTVRRWDANGKGSQTLATRPRLQDCRARPGCPTARCVPAQPPAQARSELTAARRGPIASGLRCQPTTATATGPEGGFLQHPRRDVPRGCVQRRRRRHDSCDVQTVVSATTEETPSRNGLVLTEAHGRGSTP